MAIETGGDRRVMAATETDITPRRPVVAGGFPARRLRRLRRSEGLRRMVRETTLQPDDFIYPLFVSEAITEPAPITSMPGQSQWPLGALARQAREIAALGIGGVILFGIPTVKDELGSGA